ncbi:MAG TPA: hypothetical protein PK042_07725 [Usitatibacteraceae bacterium]|nr:hypothetical protein [Usitatibacteraceae bacterium]
MTRQLLSLLAALALVATTAVAQTPCASRLFVSGYFSTVHVFDACTGAYLRDLDGRERIVGAQSIRRGPDGFLYVISEETATIHKYRNDTLEYAGEFARTGPTGPTGLAFDHEGRAYVGGYGSHDVRRYRRDGTLEDTVIAFRGAGLGGPDNGLVFGPDGNLYVPGYDSSSVVKWDPRTGLASVAVAPRTAGIRNTRGLLPARDGEHVFITAEGSGQLLRWNLASGAVTALRSGLVRPTGIDYAPDGNLLVVDGNRVVKIDPATGQMLATVVESGAGGIAGPVFVAVIARADTVDAAQVGTQFWVVGDAVFNGRTLDLGIVYTASGSEFGPGLSFKDLAIKRWGSARIELLSCTRARFSWNATGADSANYGTGAYDIERFFANEATTRCEEQGLDAADKSWVNGQWWGGQARAGEGLFLHRRSDGTTFFAWFTHRPSAELTPGAVPAHAGTQFWVVGDAVMKGRSLVLGEAYTATGASFGPGIAFDRLAIRRWGTIAIEFTGCSTGTFSWDSTGADSAGFGAGRYDVVRFFDDESAARCRERGIDHADLSWVNGQWWGGEARSGEGWFVDRRSDGTVFFAWFTHRPRSQGE